MNRAEKLLIDQVTPAFLARGFRWSRAREMFVRKEPYGFSSLLWASYETMEGGNLTVLTPVLGVRHDAVENMVNRLGLIHGEENKRYTTTVSRGLGFFPMKDHKDYIQRIRMDAVEVDVEHAAATIGSILEEEGIQFFRTYASLLECSRGLNDEITVTTHPLCNNFPRRAYYGVAAALLSQNDRAPELAAQYLEFAGTVLPNQYDQIARRLDKLLSIVRPEN